MIMIMMGCAEETLSKNYTNRVCSRSEQLTGLDFVVTTLHLVAWFVRITMRPFHVCVFVWVSVWLQCTLNRVCVCIYAWCEQHHQDNVTAIELLVIERHIRHCSCVNCTQHTTNYKHPHTGRNTHSHKHCCIFNGLAMMCRIYGQSLRYRRKEQQNNCNILHRNELAAERKRIEKKNCSKRNV